jgi:NADPH:quinone reductase-like Zn-dependent oxidoreductase
VAGERAAWAHAQAGDAVILNAATSAVGQALLQLGGALRLRCLAVVRSHGAEADAATRARLTALGATLVLVDAGSLQVGRTCLVKKVIICRVAPITESIVGQRMWGNAPPCCCV